MDNKTQKTTRQRAAVLIAATLAILAVAAALVFLAAGPNRSEQASGSSQRPYVGRDLHSLAVDPTDPEKVMVGGHEGGAISEDGGQTWLHASGLEGADPMGWVIDPSDSQKMYAGGHPGFYRSDDGGESWIKDNSGLPGTAVHGLGIDPEKPDTLYAYIVRKVSIEARTQDKAGNW